MFESIPYERPLVIGTGGGNDIVSATLIVSDLRKYGKKADLAGMCSPAAWHTYESEQERIINEVTENTERFRPCKIHKKISFIDSKVPELLKQENLDVRVYNLSCRYGTENLTVGLNRLVKENYDGIIAVDVGGDILARSKDDTILSPIMDFTLLNVLGKLNVPSTLIEFGLQTDGELRPRSCKEILQELTDEKILLDTKIIDPEDESVKVYRNIYNGIEHIRHGHTAEMTLRTFKETQDIITQYKFRVQILERKWYSFCDILLESKYFRKAFIFDPKELAKNRELAISYETPFECYLKTKKIVDTKTEMDMLYANVGEYYVWLGLLCSQIKGEERKEILRYGLENLNDYADAGILWHKDLSVIPTGYRRANIDKFLIVGKKPKVISKIAREVEKILS